MEVSMPKIIVDGTQAYIHLQGNVFLCIGEKRLVLRASPQALAVLIANAMAITHYNEINSGEGCSVH